MKGTSGRGWWMGALGLFAILLVLWVAAAVRLSAAAAAPSDLMTSLRSRLTANYAPDPGESTVRSLRLTIFQEVLRDLGMSSDDAAGQSQEMAELMKSPVPTATARDFQGAKPFTATPTVTPVPTETPTPTATNTRTPRPTATVTKTPEPATSTPEPPTSTPSVGDTDPPSVTSYSFTPTITGSGCTADLDISADIYDAPMSSGISGVQVKYKMPPYVTSYTYLGNLSYCSGGIQGDGSWQGCYDGVVPFAEISSGSCMNPGPTDFQIEIYVKPIDNLGQHTYNYVGTFTLPYTCDD